MLRYLDDIMKDAGRLGPVQEGSPGPVSRALRGGEPALLSGIRDVALQNCQQCLCPRLAQRGLQAGLCACRLRVHVVLVATDHPAPATPQQAGRACPAAGVSQHRPLTQGANSPAVDGRGRAAVAVGRGGRAAARMLSNLHTTGSGERGHGVSCIELGCKGRHGCRWL